MGAGTRNADAEPSVIPSGFATADISWRAELRNRVSFNLSAAFIKQFTRNSFSTKAVVAVAPSTRRPVDSLSIRLKKGDRRPINCDRGEIYDGRMQSAVGTLQ